MGRQGNIGSKGGNLEDVFELCGNQRKDKTRSLPSTQYLGHVHLAWKEEGLFYVKPSIWVLVGAGRHSKLDANRVHHPIRTIRIPRITIWIA